MITAVFRPDPYPEMMLTTMPVMLNLFFCGLDFPASYQYALTVLVTEMPQGDGGGWINISSAIPEHL